MSEHPLIARQRTLLRDLARLGVEQSRVVPILAQDYRKETDRARDRPRGGRREPSPSVRRRGGGGTGRGVRVRRSEKAEARFQADKDACKNEHRRLHHDLTTRLAAEAEAAEAAVQARRWMLQATLEATLQRADGASATTTSSSRDAWKNSPASRPRPTPSC